MTGCELEFTLFGRNGSALEMFAPRARLTNVLIALGQGFDGVAPTVTQGDVSRRI